MVQAVDYESRHYAVFLVLRRGRVCVDEVPTATSSDAGWDSAMGVIVVASYSERVLSLDTLGCRRDCVLL